ncbi:hypothetical protein NDU88_007093 [Pleurodeles waltl]|uniref:Reverse transcriptase n=1 Tax=Pleurodeles waltl TaxID=8319 RepID=A0AAV7QNP5_PLEWA|nr:hypothetical protein NDU88_007093 [Pleurodeles waltl]
MRDGLLKQQESLDPLLTLRNGVGNLVHSQAAINGVFQAHFRAICMSRGEDKHDHGLALLAEIDLPRLMAESRATLQKPITRVEVVAAVKKFNTANSPGSDGLPAEFDQKYADQVGGYAAEGVPGGHAVGLPT